MKRMAKSWLAILLISVLMLSLFACATEEPDAPDVNPDVNETPTGDDPNPTPEPEPEPLYDLKNYTIVYPDVADTSTSAATSLLQQSLKDKGLQLSVKKDSYLGVSNEAEYEILVGDTNRSASADALLKIESEKGYVIQFFDKQIAIRATLDEVLDDAVTYFVETYVHANRDYVIDAEVGDYYGAVQRQLAQSGAFDYHLVVGANASSSVQAAAKRLQTKLQTMSGVAVTLSTDATYDKQATNIVVGATSYPESNSTRFALQINQYGVCLKDAKIVLTGHHDKTIEMAVEKFIEFLDTQTTASNGNVIGYFPLNGAYSYSEWLGNIPDFARGTYQGVYESGENNLQILYRNVQESYLDEYVGAVCSYGYEVKEDNVIGENRSITLVGEQGLVHVGYFKYNNSVSIITDPLTQTVYKDSEPAYTKVTENTLAVSTLLYTHREVTDGNGMSYVITLEDGRYIIIDGGYADQKTGESQADVLFEFLEDNYKKNERKIEIAAWIFSHSHGDHYGAFQSFSTKYANFVNIEYFIYNATSTDMYPSFDSFLAKTLPTYIPTYYPNAKIIKPHIGQILKFCNVEFEVLYAQEHFAPGKMSQQNDSSLMLRMHVNGQTVLFTGDAEVTASGHLCKMYGNYLKSDILQINHHGYSGGTVDLYDLVDPTYTMWPTSQEAFDLRTTGEKYQWIGNAVVSNKHVYDKVGRANCFVADGPVEIIHFPLNDKLLDIEYYNHS